MHIKSERLVQIDHCPHKAAETHGRKAEIWLPLSSEVIKPRWKIKLGRLHPCSLISVRHEQPALTQNVLCAKTRRVFSHYIFAVSR